MLRIMIELKEHSSYLAQVAGTVVPEPALPDLTFHSQGWGRCMACTGHRWALGAVPRRVQGVRRHRLAQGLVLPVLVRCSVLPSLLCSCSGWALSSVASARPQYLLSQCGPSPGWACLPSTTS